jgi:hypothetical protein
VDLSPAAYPKAQKIDVVKSVAHLESLILQYLLYSNLIIRSTGQTTLNEFSLEYNTE